MSNETIAKTWFLIIASVFAGGIIAATIEQKGWHTATINRGLAQYCPNNGEWAWKGECK